MKSIVKLISTSVFALAFVVGTGCAEQPAPKKKDDKKADAKGDEKADGKEDAKAEKKAG